MKKNLLLIGSGYMAREYLNVIEKYFDNFSVSLISSSKDRSNELEKKYNILETFESIDKLLLHEKDFSKYQKIIVCTSEKRFLNLAKVLTNYECEVLFEKPLGLSFEESLKIIELSNDKFFLALNRRFYDGINELRNLISNKKLIHGLILDQQSEHDWSDRRLTDINKELVYSNSIHIIDLAFFLIKNQQVDDYSVKNIKSKNKNISKYRISINSECDLEYLRHNNIPGKWQIILFFKDIFVYFENLESFSVFNDKRQIIMSSKPQNEEIKPGLKNLLESFLNKDFVTQTPKVEDCIKILGLVNSLR